MNKLNISTFFIGNPNNEAYNKTSIGLYGKYMLVLQLDDTTIQKSISNSELVTYHTAHLTSLLTKFRSHFYNIVNIVNLNILSLFLKYQKTKHSEIY